MDKREGGVLLDRQGVAEGRERSVVDRIES